MKATTIFKSSQRPVKTVNTRLGFKRVFTPATVILFCLFFYFPQGSAYSLSGFSGNSRHMSHNGGTNRGDSAVCFFNRDLKCSGAIYSNVAQNNLVSDLDRSLYDWFIKNKPR